jgi:hypothetical protein
MINGCAKLAGVTNDKLPFPKVLAPTKRHNDITEYMGFCTVFHVPTKCAILPKQVKEIQTL